MQTLLELGTPLQLAWCVLVILAGYTLRGATGFGAGVVVIPLLLFVVPLRTMIPVITTLGIIASFGQSVRERTHVEWRVLRSIVVPALGGVALGLWLFAALDAQLLQRGFGAFIIAYAIWNFLPTPMLRVAHEWLAVIGGITGGVVATVFGGMAGPFFVIYLNALGLDKTRFRASISIVLFTLALVRASGYLTLGLFDAHAIALFALLLPAMVIAMVAGERLHSRLDERRFRRVVAVLLVGSGIALMFK